MELSRHKKILLLFIIILPWGCRTPQTEIPGNPVIQKRFTHGYDEVWEALEELMVDNLMLPIRTKDKNRGIIQTDWISVIRIRGTLRWYVKVILEGDDNNTEARLYIRVEEPTSAKEDVGKMKTKQGDIKTGWSVSNEKIPEAQDILNTLSLKLGE